MRQVIRTALVMAAAVQASAALSAATAQAGGQPPGKSGQVAAADACSLLSAAEMKQITGRENPLNLPPSRADPADLPKGVSECSYLGIDLSLTSQMTREWFDATRKDQVKSGEKVTPVSGVGDEAYFWERPGGSDSQVGIAMRVGQQRLAMQDMVRPDSVESVKPILLALAKAAAAKMR